MRSLIIAGMLATGFALAGSAPSQAAPASSPALAGVSGAEFMVVDVRRRRCSRRCWHPGRSTRVRCRYRCWR